MQLKEVLNPKAVIIDFQAKDKRAVIKELAEVATKTYKLKNAAAVTRGLMKSPRRRLHRGRGDFISE